MASKKSRVADLPSGESGDQEEQEQVQEEVQEQEQEEEEEEEEEVRIRTRADLWACTHAVPPGQRCWERRQARRRAQERSCMTAKQRLADDRRAQKEAVVERAWRLSLFRSMAEEEQALLVRGAVLAAKAQQQQQNRDLESESELVAEELRQLQGLRAQVVHTYPEMLLLLEEGCGSVSAAEREEARERAERFLALCGGVCAGEECRMCLGL